MHGPHRKHHVKQDQLPEPVSSYLRRALGRRSAPIKRARLVQRGELRTDVRATRWLAFTAEEVINPVDIAFAWVARVRIAPLIDLRVQDSYENGEGAGRVSMLSAITIAKEHGSTELNSGALLRFLAEAPWYPSALVPSEHLRWSIIDEARATAALTDRGLTVNLEFRFDSSGDVATIYADRRPRKVATGYQMAAWEGHFYEYAQQDGLRVPLRAEVGWYADSIWAYVWRGRIVRASYEFCQ